ncbi:MAG: tryptophan 7-halogenase [Gammaproteobacteria bacterium]
MTRACDVAVVGGGPAGCATALCLRAHAPALSICIIESSRYEGPRLGETLPPPARRLLEHLEVWDEFQQETPLRVHGTTARWGGPDCRDNDFIYVPQGSGWHVDRAAFDAMLARVGAARGTEVLLSTRVRSLEEMPEGWRLELSDGAARLVRFVVDATGRSALIARTRGARFVQIDHLAGFSRFFEDSGGDPRTLVEACSYGWWYTAGLPGGRRVAACMTDADLGRSLRLHESPGFTRLIAETRYVRNALNGAEVRGPVRVRSTESRYLDPASGAGWLAVGDAASIFDPLSSQGILKALRSGVYAGYAIGDRLLGGDDSGLTRYRRFVQVEFESYASLRADYYRAEHRWPDSAFWRRRQAG